MNRFFVQLLPLMCRLLATGYLDLSTGSIEAVFTLPQYTGKKGLGDQIVEAIKSEARGRGFEQLTLSSTFHAETFLLETWFQTCAEKACIPLP
ncbi:GNAT family N-acetyltransferase [Klebsiella pneumoniae]|nr:GNAT family N-acetyltransferase [Klebsiella pneumoniae]